MKKRVGLLAFTALLLVQAVYPAGGLAANGSYLAVPARLDSAFFRQACSAILLAISVYKLDAINGRHKDDIIKECGSSLARDDVLIDLERIDRLRKGWTRYYPVTIAGQPFIVRIFLTSERKYQSEMSVIFETVMEEPSITCQILPGINTILSSCRIKPHSISLDLQAARSP